MVTSLGEGDGQAGSVKPGGPRRQRPVLGSREGGGGGISSRLPERR